MACGVPTDDHPRPIPDERVPFDLLDPAPAPTAPASPDGSASATVFMVAGDRLSPVLRNVGGPASADTVLQALLAGVMAEEAAGNLRTAIPSGTRASVAEEAGGRVRVELSPAFVDNGASERVLAVAQIVYSLTGVPGVDSLTVSISGRTVAGPTGDGTLRSGPVRRADFAAVAKL